MRVGLSLIAALALLLLVACCLPLPQVRASDADADVDVEDEMEMEMDADMDMGMDMDSEGMDLMETDADLDSSLPGEGTRCAYNGVAGLCTAFACPGTSHVGLCPGPAQVRCCVSNKLVGEGSKCTANGVSGVCTASASACGAGKKRVAGFCPGPTQVQCCIEDKNAKPAPAKTPSGSCEVSGSTGVCTSGACTDGEKFAGFCPGDKSIQCCVKQSATSVWQKPLTAYGTFRYTFPYAKGLHIVAHVQRQKLRVYDGKRVLKEYAISSGARGLSNQPNSYASPFGMFKVKAKVGEGMKLGMVFESLKPTGQIGKPTDAKAHVQTRVLVLEGLDPENRNTASRNIYIHGTNAEMQLGWRASHGCFRMGNEDVVDLFKRVPSGTLFFSAWKPW